MNQLEEVANKIGMVVINLLGLEYILRAFLYSISNQDKKEQGFSLDPKKLAGGGYVPENYFTNFDSLKKLIDNVNAKLKSRGITEQIDGSVVELRDAIAHGRLSSDSTNAPLYILKFDRPKSGRAMVTTCIEVTPEWLTLQVQHVWDERQKVVRIGQSIGLNIFPKE
jgi:hypothetical protein